jgi:hypothetical protein
VFEQLEGLLTYPTRRLWEENHANEGNNGEEDLQGDGKTELGFAGIVGEAVV